MDRKAVQTIYDRHHAASYDDRFHHYEKARPDTEYELGLLRGLLRNGERWLDIGCGTGFCLSKFPENDRAGLDLSADMLARAREANPGVPFYQRDMLDECPEWTGRWDVVSCMWQAFGYLESLGELRRMVANMARWTSDAGCCFVPMIDPRVISDAPGMPYSLPADWDGACLTRATIWTYLDEHGNYHDILTPFGEYMTELFRVHFEEVLLIQYPPLPRPEWSIRRSMAVISRRKRSQNV